MTSEVPMKGFLAVNKVTVSLLLLLLLDVVKSGGDTWKLCSHLVTRKRLTS